MAEPSTRLQDRSSKNRKTRTGCVTCKSRHVKCDEGRPACSNCSRAGRDCRYDEKKSAAGAGGAQTAATEPVALKPKTWEVAISNDRRSNRSLFYGVPALSNGNSLRATSSSTISSPAALPPTTPSLALDFLNPSPRLALPLIPSADPEEPYLLRLFSLGAAAEIRRNPDSLISNWVGLVQEAVQTNHAVRDAALACTSFQLQRSQDPSKMSVPYQYYNRAINHLNQELRYSDHSAIHVSLLVCCLFIRCEVLLQNQKLFMLHIFNGERISLAHQAYRPRCANTVVDYVFASLFTRVPLFYVPFISCGAPLPALLQSPLPHMSDVQDLSGFEPSTVFFCAIVNSTYQLLFRATPQLEHRPDKQFDVPLTFEADRAHHIALLDLWQSSFDSSVSTKKFLLSENNQTQAVLLMAAIATLKIQLEVTNVSAYSESAYDNHTAGFRSIIDSLEKVVAVPYIYTHITPSALLLFIALKCRDPRLRRDAVALLRVVKCDESFWEGAQLVKVALAVIAAEEEGSPVAEASDLSEGRRARGLKIDIEAGKHATIRFWRRRRRGRGTWIQREISVDC